MKLTTVIGSVNDNPKYYLFIPKQVIFWKKFGIRFITLFVGESIPEEIKEYSDNIILWNKNLDINTAFVGQNLRTYYTALLDLPDDEMVMITDMDMLPMNKTYYTEGLEEFTIDDFVYYRYIYNNEEIFMCYNAAHPKTWSKVFDIKSVDDIQKAIYDTYNSGYNGIPGSTGWNIDQLVMYKKLINYPHLKVLNKPINRLEQNQFIYNLNSGLTHFINQYDDCHFHRNYHNNSEIIENAEKQLHSIYN